MADALSATTKLNMNMNRMSAPGQRRAATRPR